MMPVRAIPLVPDVPTATPDATPADGGAFGKLLDDVGASLDRASRAENAFAAHAGSLQDAVYERARADVVVAAAAAAASRVVQCVQTLTNMQV